MVAQKDWEKYTGYASRQAASLVPRAAYFWRSGRGRGKQ